MFFSTYSSCFPSLGLPLPPLCTDAVRPRTLRAHPSLDQMRNRDRVLLLGDSLGDLNMAKGLDAEQVLTVGFLNDKASILYSFLFCRWQSRSRRWAFSTIRRVFFFFFPLEEGVGCDDLLDSGQTDSLTTKGESCSWFAASGH